MEVKSNEVAFEASGVYPVNGWHVGQVGQQLGMQAREAIKDGWGYKNVRLVLICEVEEIGNA
jgi:hypothetical protein